MRTFWQNQKKKQFRKNGFTIIELLVSMTLISIIFTVISVAIFDLSKSWDTGVQKASSIETINSALTILKRDVEGLRRLTEQTGKTHNYKFRGTSQNLSFVVVEPDYPTRSAPYVISYEPLPNAHSTGLIRKRQAYTNNISFNNKERNAFVEILGQDHKYEFIYGKVSNDQIKWFRLWNDSKSLPDLVKIRIRKKGNKKLESFPYAIKITANAEYNCLKKTPVNCSVLGQQTKSSSSGKQQK